MVPCGSALLRSTPQCIIQVPHHSYQPSRAELRKDLRLKGSFQDAIKALVRPVKVRYVKPSKND